MSKYIPENNQKAFSDYEKNITGIESENLPNYSKFNKW